VDWILLVLAGVLEAFWAVGLKATEGFTRPLISVLVALAIAGSMLLLAQAARTIPIGTAYAVWVGIGVFGAVLLESWLYAVPLGLTRVAFLALLLVSIVGLKASA
jgi:quaternary ammonium compound-resistance protein SugE